MQVLVKTPFIYAHDGFHGVALKPGDLVTIHDELVESYVADGLVELIRREPEGREIQADVAPPKRRSARARLTK